MPNDNNVIDICLVQLTIIPFYVLSGMVYRNEIYLNLAVKTLLSNYTHNSSCSSKYLQNKPSYWPDSYYFR